MQLQRVQRKVLSKGAGCVLREWRKEGNGKHADMYREGRGINYILRLKSNVTICMKRSFYSICTRMQRSSSDTWLGCSTCNVLPSASRSLL